MNEIENIKERLRDLEFHAVQSEKWSNMKIHKLEKNIAWFRITVAFTFILIIGHMAKWL